MSIAGQLTIRRHRDEDAEIDITPMIDIVFLLLAFFIVVSKMDPKRNVQLPISEVASNIPEKRCVMIYVDKINESDEDATVFLGNKGNIQVIGSNEEQSSQIREYVNNTIIGNPALKYIMIKAHGDAKNGLIERVKVAAASAEAVGDRELLVGVESKRMR